jgi:hypothetical protein
MFVLFTTPIGLFLLDLFGDRPGAATLAAGLSMVGFVSVLGVGRRWMEVSLLSKQPGRIPRAVLLGFRAFVGNGDVIQAVARRIDPDWLNPYAGRTPRQTMAWLESLELTHWAALAGSVAPVSAMFAFGRPWLGMAYVVANLVYNVGPNLLIRDTRRRLLRVVGRRPAEQRYAEPSDARETSADSVPMSRSTPRSP